MHIVQNGLLQMSRKADRLQCLFGHHTPKWHLRCVKNAPHVDWWIEYSCYICGKGITIGCGPYRSKEFVLQELRDRINAEQT